MPPTIKNVDYNSSDYKFPPPTDASPLFYKGLIQKELLPIWENSER